MSRDPLGYPDGPLNGYAYVANSPYQFVDPFGLSQSVPWLRGRSEQIVDTTVQTDFFKGLATNIAAATANQILDAIYDFLGPKGDPSGGIYPGEDGGRKGYPADWWGCMPLDPRKAPPPLDVVRPRPGNKGQHGLPDHNAQINRKYRFLAWVANPLYMAKSGGFPHFHSFRKHQEQVNANGMKVSTCKPDLQYTMGSVAGTGGIRYLEEFFRPSMMLLSVNKSLIMNRADPFAFQILNKIGGVRRR